jgi:8-oxo-dGTP diphosphatase
MTIGKFMGGIAAIIYDSANNTYLLLKRAATKAAGANEWESVTGRVDQGESFEQALHREVYEELHTTVTIEFLIGTSHFYRGAATPENELLGVRYLCTIHDVSSIAISDEHSEYRWGSLQQVKELLSEEHWLRQSIQQADAILSLLPDELQSMYQQIYSVNHKFGSDIGNVGQLDKI